MEDSAVEFFDRGLGDAKVRSIAWTDDDLVIELVLPADGSTGRVTRFQFRAVADLRIDMDYGVYVGQPLLFDAVATRTATGWTVKFEFGAAPEGMISFECSAISV